MCSIVTVFETRLNFDKTSDKKAEETTLTRLKEKNNNNEKIGSPQMRSQLKYCGNQMYSKKTICLKCNKNN